MNSKIKLPPVFEINENWNGNRILQIVEAGSVLDGDVGNYTGERIKGRVITALGNGTQILIVEKAAEPPSHFSATLKIKHQDQATNGLLDLSSGNWLAHPKLSKVTSESIDYAKKLEAVTASWANSFSYLEEHQALGTPGLRLPQIGAVHAIHAHWAVSNEAATIVMPTGTGKTETMLAIEPLPTTDITVWKLTVMP